MARSSVVGQENGVVVKKRGKSTTRRQPNGAVIVRTNGRNGDLLLDPESIKDWDDEELQRGYRKDKNGRFTGRPPKIIPKLVHDEFVRRTIAKAKHDIIAIVPELVDQMKKLLENPATDDKAKVALMKLLMEHVFGKAPQTHEHEIKTPLFLKVLEGGIVPGDLESIETTAREVAS